ncbi:MULTISPECIES: ParB/RepB/Spo0J family partition protein [unclassified Streptomyces]|uniref:ParB/RepB/Spo0J family partition protein n=1 Tax=unclassified Streptomyces TaxID=2593676 RepID=UPI002E8097DC|nr:ParB/RepB/Spo0J family partition protein [Streptomyces sp. NBC_00589]WTI37499.1 ParB/RepB/Spo0J family partition protein [Streptomyces sp. NBC_00775]WUB28823.1 ParB/RepB/Spo0J family partition protein [Streptomyces sp. NBC_00589]
MTITTLPLDRIHRNERQPREFFEPGALQELADSIKRFGLMQPIEVRKDGEAGGYEIVAGERRWRAHQLAELTEIKCIVTDDDLTALERFKRSVAENINRADMTPMEEAKAFRRILDEQKGAEPKDVAKEFGKSTQYVTLRLALLDLTEEVQQHVNSGAIGTQAAVQIAALTPGNQAAVMKKWAKGAFAGDNELVHFAYALKQQQGQIVAMIMEEMSPEEREERQRERTKTRSNIDRIEQILGLLEELAKADPMKLALALEGEVGKRVDQMDRVADAVAKARFNMRQAKAHAEAREIASLNPDAEHTSLAAAKPKAPAEAATPAVPAADAATAASKPKAPVKRAQAKPAAAKPQVPARRKAPARPKAPAKRAASATA